MAEQATSDFRVSRIHRLAKLTGNKARDRRVNRLLRAKGWNVIRVWEHELKRRDEARLIRRLKKLLPA
jgi:DNA mismatch endonuclease (patch repair protein)